MNTPRRLPVIENCWSSIGVRGDRSCERLAQVTHCQNCEVFSSIARGLLDRPASPDYLAEVTGFVAESAEAQKQGNQSVLLFSLAGEGYAVWARDVLEVAEVAAPRRVPHRTNAIFRGLVNIQGQLLLCVSLAGLLCVRDAGGGAKVRVLVVAHDGQRWVFAIDAVKGMHRVEASELLEPPAGSARRERAFLTGLLRHQGAAYGVLDVSRLCQASAEHIT